MDLHASSFRDRLAERLLPAGLDLVHAFDASLYNEAIRQHARLTPLPLFERERALAVLVGNTRELWPRFVEAYRASPELKRHPHPIDHYVTETVSACARDLPARIEVRFSHEGGSRLVSMLHVAQASGFAHRGPAHLAIHPEHGPWIALRAVIVVDADAPPPSPPDAEPACASCSAPCQKALARAMSSPAATWRDWVAVRDACPVGHPSRYDEPQLRYHYTKSRADLDDVRGA
ncbi:hypothetical protein [Vulgatibacter incomptus]|uniref:Ferredoxin n=1 Tax=Vulgatibacter incomptus TaxID=1391653 RepID=A0A0K1PEP8_9BACT|nr:hypothetical protein [Vulgatibacter incomptus]AKU92008.1 Ferredoxin [Vulgatibacter incomptus]